MIITLLYTGNCHYNGLTIASICLSSNCQCAHSFPISHISYNCFFLFVSIFQVRGRYEQIDGTSIRITELPLGTWTQAYKEFLETLLVASEKTPACIKDYKEHHTDTTVSFTVTMTEDQMRDALAQGIDKRFRLESTISTSNMVRRWIFDYRLNNNNK